MKTKKLKVTRLRAHNIFLALGILGTLKITTRMRYNVALCKSRLQPIISAMEEANPEPNLGGYLADEKALSEQALSDEERAEEARALMEKHKAILAAHDKWKSEQGAFMGEEIEIEVIEVPLECEIDDDVRFTDPGLERSRQNQALVEALIDVLVVT